MGLSYSRNAVAVNKVFDFPDFTTDNVKINDREYLVINTPLMTAAPVDTVRLARTVFKAMNTKIPVNIAIKGQLTDAAFKELLDNLGMAQKPRVEILGATIVKNDVPLYEITDVNGHRLELDVKTSAKTVDEIANAIIAATEEARNHLEVTMSPSSERLSLELLEELRVRVGARRLDRLGDDIVVTFGGDN